MIKKNVKRLFKILLIIAINIIDGISSKFGLFIRKSVSKINNVLNPNYNHNDIENIFMNLQCYDDAWNKDYYEKQWNELKEKYDKIKLYFFKVNAFGEMIASFCIFFHRRETIDDRTFYICMPYTAMHNRIINNELLNIFRQYVNIVTPENVCFWKYVVIHHKENLDLSCLNNVHIRQNYPPYIFKPHKGIISVPDLIMQYGNMRKRQLGIEGKHVCFFARSELYFERTTDERETKSISYRNAPFIDYLDAIKWLHSIGYVSVRMGRCENAIDSDEFIDYAGTGGDDRMDIYLSANCEFFVGACSGLVLLPALFGVPTLTVNLVPSTLGWGAEPSTEVDLYIPKKYYSIKRKRYLSYIEIAEIDAYCMLDGREYEKKGIKILNNTPEEILDAVIEMHKRLNGMWTVKEEENIIYEKYFQTVEKVESIIDKGKKNRRKNWMGCAPRIRIAYSYLSKNLYLLDGIL